MRPPRGGQMDTTRRNVLITGAVAAGRAATRSLAQQPAGNGENAAKIYTKGNVRIHYQEAGSGFPLLLIPGGGLNATMSFFTMADPFNAIDEFKNEYRCITWDLRNANGSQSSGPL